MNNYLIYFFKKKKSEILLVPHINLFEFVDTFYIPRGEGGDNYPISYQINFNMTSFHNGSPCTNRYSRMAVPKMLDSLGIHYFGVPQVSSNKLSPGKQVLPAEKAHWDEVNNSITPTMRESQVALCKQVGRDEPVMLGIYSTCHQVRFDTRSFRWGKPRTNRYSCMALTKNA